MPFSSTAASGRRSPSGLMRAVWDGGLKAAMSFGVVGLGGMVIDVAIFNALRLGLFGHGALIDKPLTASVVSASVAIVFNWVGARYWTFRTERRTDVARELLEYGAVALLGLGVSLLCLATSHYVLGLHSIAADNVAKNVVGLGLGTIVRFSLARWWIWRPDRGREAVAVRTETGVLPVIDPE